MFDVADRIDPHDFLASFINSDAGRTVIAQRQADRDQHRRDLARQAVEAEAERDRLLGPINESLDKTQTKIAALTEQLKSAQIHRSEMQARRFQAVKRCRDITASNRKALAATMPTALRDLISFASYVEAAAGGMRYRASRTVNIPGPMPGYVGFDWSALRNRADRVGREAEALVMQPDTSAGRFAELEAALAPVPGEFRKAWLKSKGE